MKKKIAALVCTFALVAAMPVMAWAAPSSADVHSATIGNEQDVSLTVDGKTSDGGTISVSLTGEQASNVQLTSTMKVVGTFKVSHTGTVTGPFTFTFAGLDKYNGATATVFIQHEDDFASMAPETKTAKVSNGTVTVSSEGLSLVTIAVDTATVTGAANASTDASATSPQTDVDLSGVAGATVACAVAAAGVGIALRKKATK